MNLLQEKLEVFFNFTSSASPKDKERMVKVLSIWKRGTASFSQEVVEKIEQLYFTIGKYY